MTTRARPQGGFTLIEVLFALSILFASLVVFLQATTADLEATNRARLLTAATGLASSKLLDIEELLYKDGFSDFAEELDGDFTEEGFPRYRWVARIEQVELPTLNQSQTAASDLADKATDMKGGTGGPSGQGGKGGGLGGAKGSDSSTAGESQTAMGSAVLQSQFEPVKKLLESGLRKVAVTVSWPVGKKEEKFTVICYFADLKAVDIALRDLGLGK